MKLPELEKCGRKGCGHKAGDWSTPCPEDGCVRLKILGNYACAACYATMPNEEFEKVKATWHKELKKNDY